MKKIEEVIRQIVEINNFEIRQVEIFGEKYQMEAIRLHICSGGGEVAPTIGLIEMIKHSFCPVIGICSGLCASAAFLLFISCTFRSLMAGSELMMHPSKGGVFGTLQSCQNDIKAYERTEKTIKKLLNEFTNIPQNVINDCYEKQLEIYIDEEKAMDWKICDEIYGVNAEETKKEEKNKVNKKKTTKKKGKKK